MAKEFYDPYWVENKEEWVDPQRVEILKERKRQLELERQKQMADEWVKKEKIAPYQAKVNTDDLEQYKENKQEELGKSFTQGPVDGYGNDIVKTTDSRTVQTNTISFTPIQPNFENLADIEPKRNQKTEKKSEV